MENATLGARPGREKTAVRHHGTVVKSIAFVLFGALAACSGGGGGRDGDGDGERDVPDTDGSDPAPDTSPDAADMPDPDGVDLPGDEPAADCEDDGFIPEGLHVSPDGSASGDGSAENPWDLATALSQPGAVLPGSILWLHGGTYGGSFASDLSGAEGQPVTVRSYPGEWAVIDGGPSGETTLTLRGSWTVYQGFEVTNSNPERWGGRPEGMYVVGENLKLVNLVMHDLGNNGFWTSALNLEIYGCILYNNGYDDSDRAHGHAIYTQNLDGTKRIVENIIFNGYSFGIHAYTEGGSIQGFDIIGNVWFLSGAAALGTGTLKDNCLVGGLQPAARVLLQENFGWADSPTTRSVRLGYDNPDNEDVTLLDNYFVGETSFAQPWASITMTGNTFLSAVEGVDTSLYPDNTYLDERPAGVDVHVRLNAYESQRAHVIVYNWDLAGSVDVDLSGVLLPGARYEVRNAQNYFAAPVAEGIYDGSPVTLPLAGLEPAQPVGSEGAIDATEMTGAEFNVFVVIGSC
jgi:hypothetical protein